MHFSPSQLHASSQLRKRRIVSQCVSLMTSSKQKVQHETYSEVQDHAVPYRGWLVCDDSWFTVKNMYRDRDVALMILTGPVPKFSIKCIWKLTRAWVTGLEKASNHDFQFLWTRMVIWPTSGAGPALLLPDLFLGHGGRLAFLMFPLLWSAVVCWFALYLKCLSWEKQPSLLVKSIAKHVCLIFKLYHIMVRVSFALLCVP